METTVGIFQANIVLVEPTNRFICGSLEPSAGQVHQLAATAGRDGSGCIPAGLGQLEVLCVPAFQTHPQMLVKDLEGSSGCTTADAGLASTTLVANDNGVGLPAASYPETVNLLSDPEGNPRPLLARGSLLMARWAISGKDSKREAFRAKWSTYSWQEIVKPHQLPIRAAGTVGSVGVQNGLMIPCLLL